MIQTVTLRFSRGFEFISISVGGFGLGNSSVAFAQATKIFSTEINFS